MPRPLLDTQQKSSQQMNLKTEISIKSKLNPLQLERRLRERRSRKYVEMIKQLDACGCQMDQSKYQEFINAVNDEFPDIELEDQLVGIVAKCYLGNPYDVHTLDLMGNIVVHYKMSENMPEMLNRARSLALHGGYEFVEVYMNCLRAIKEDGTVTLAK